MDYKEKLEEAKRLYESANADQKYVLESLFPELAGSEDEQIRKRIIHALHGDVLDMEETNKALAWLEKQVEYKSPEELLKIRQELYQSGYNDGYKHGYEDSKKQDEQKPIIAMKTPEESLGIDSETYNEIVDECIYGENKPADKVESKFKVKYAGSEYNVFETKEIAGVTFYGIEDEPNHIDYVKAENCEIISGGYGIKENGCSFPINPIIFSEQKPAWSEEDKFVVEDIEEAVINYWHGQSQEDLLDWLKALKQRIGG